MLSHVSSALRHFFRFEERNDDLWRLDIARLSLPQALEATAAEENKLSRASKEFENKYLYVLETIEELRNVSEALSESSHSLLSLSQSENNPIRSISQKLTPHLAFIQSSAQSFQELTTGLAENKQSIDKILSFESALDKTISQLTYIRTLFGVEAAPLDEKVKVMFTSLVEEIHSLQSDVTEIFAKHFSSMKKHKALITQTNRSLIEQARAQLELFDQHKSEVDESLEDHEKALEASTANNAALDDYSRQICEIIGSALISLQSQDIISQKIQHVHEISEEIRGRFESIRSARNKTRRCAEYRFIEYASYITENLIASIKSDLSDSDRQIRASFARVSGAINTVGETCGSQSRQSTRECENHGRELLQALESTASTISQTVSFSKQAFDQILPMRTMADNVTQIILGLSAQLHLIGLNAEVHAAQTGGSSGLEILSSSTSSISIETRNLCQQASERLDALLKNLNANVNEFEGLYESATRIESVIRADTDAQSSNLNRFETSYQSAFQVAVESIDQLKNLLVERASTLDLEDLLIQELNGLQALHQTISSRAKKKADSLKIAIAIPPLMEGLLDRYTMNSELAIHFQSLGLEPPAQSNQQISASNQDADIEFFDTDEDRSQNVVPESASTANSKDDYGDNVELF